MLMTRIKGRLQKEDICSRCKTFVITQNVEDKTKNYFNLLSSKAVYTYRVSDASIWRRVTSWHWLKKYFGKDWVAFRHSIFPNWKRRTFSRTAAGSRPDVGILEMSIVFFASCWTIWRGNTLQQNTDTDTVTDIFSWSQVVEQVGGEILFNRILIFTPSFTQSVRLNLKKVDALRWWGVWDEAHTL